MNKIKELIKEDLIEHNQEEISNSRIENFDKVDYQLSIDDKKKENEIILQLNTLLNELKTNIITKSSLKNLNQVLSGFINSLHFLSQSYNNHKSILIQSFKNITPSIDYLNNEIAIWQNISKEINEIVNTQIKRVLLIQIKKIIDKNNNEKKEFEKHLDVIKRKKELFKKEYELIEKSNILLKDLSEEVNLGDNKKSLEFTNSLITLENDLLSLFEELITLNKLTLEFNKFVELNGVQINGLISNFNQEYNSLIQEKNKE